MNLSLVQPELWLTVLAFVVLGIDLLMGRSARGFVAWVAVFGLLGITAFSGCLLVTGDAGNRNTALIIAEYIAGRSHLWQHGSRYLEQLKQIVVPIYRVEVEQHGS